MIKLNDLKVSYHFQNDRTERKARIDAIVNDNFGQVVCEEWYKDAWRCLSDTGLIFIVNEQKTIILTYYFATMQVASCMYRAAGRKMPKAVENKVRKNAIIYDRLYHKNINEKWVKGLD